MIDNTPGALPEKLDKISALVEVVAALRVAIDEANGYVERAVASLVAGDDQAAVGALAGLHVALSDAIALQRVAIVLGRGCRGRNPIGSIGA